MRDCGIQGFDIGCKGANMAKDDQQEAFERLLYSTLTRALDFLKYAEAKNAALLTFASAWILGSISLLTKCDTIYSEWQSVFIVTLPIFVGAALSAIISFLPKTSLGEFHEDPERLNSLVYFGDAAIFSPASYRDRLRERYYPPEGESATRNYLDDLAIQIAVNSRIVTRKLKFFNAGAGLVLVALAILSVPMLKALWRLIIASFGVS